MLKKLATTLDIETKQHGKQHKHKRINQKY